MSLKVLVVEDDPATLELMREVLSSVGVEVRPMGDSEEAAALIEQQKFDGIFLDLMMPKLDGFELARRIRRSSWNRRTPIVIITGREDKLTMEEAFAAGATFFLPKPIDRGRLIRLLNTTRGTMLEERRRFRRIPLLTEVTCQAGGHGFSGMSANISLDGLLFDTDGSLAPGDAISLHFLLPGQQGAIEAKAAVVRIDEKKRAGVRFTSLSAHDRERLRILVASQEENQ
jgi:CheY-like chemotaxis protein